MKNGVEQQTAPPPVHEQHVPAMVQYYAETASKYNEWHADLTISESHNFAVERLLSLIKEKKYANFLDICCGTGRAIKAILGAGINAHGIDISQDLINTGIKEWGLPKECFSCGDATKLPFADKQFDITCVMGALHHSAVPEKIISEMLRVTRHTVVISDCGNRFSGGIKAILQKLGLFNIVYRLIFRRPPRTTRRAIISHEDGPAFVFSVDEILPMVRAQFPLVETHNFYFKGKRHTPWLPRLFASHVVLVASRGKQ